MWLWGRQQIQESDLIQGCINGDRRMQEQLYKIFSPTMLGICLRYAGDYMQAEDMMQEGFIRVFSNINRFRGDGSFEGWLKRIFINSAIEGYRKNLVMNQMADIEHYSDRLIQPDELSRLHVADLMKMVQSLAVGYRTVFNLYAIEGYSHQEIADMLGITVGTSKSQLARARYLLQKMVLNSKKIARYAAAF